MRYLLAVLALLVVRDDAARASLYQLYALIIGSALDVLRFVLTGGSNG